MKRSIVPLLLVFLVIAGAEAREEGKPHRVGVLFWHDSANDPVAFEGVKAGFALAGLPVEFEVVNVRENEARARKRLLDWEKRGFDLVYALGTSAAIRARNHLERIPVVFTAVTNPVLKGLAPSWDGCGGNLCGNSNWIPRKDLLAVFKAAVPDLFRLGVVLNPENPVPMEEVAEVKKFFAAEPEHAIRLLEVGLRDPKELEDPDAKLREAVTRAIELGAQALWVPIDPDVYRRLDVVASVTAPLGIPIVSSQASAVKSHAVVAVAVDYHLLGQRSVILAEKVLRQGADPGKLPIGRMRSFDVKVNLAAARRARFEIPLPLLATADEILDEGGEAR